MRVYFRIGIYEGEKRLSKVELKGSKDPLSIGMRYVLEFKYLEASKWLMLAEDCWEKYALLALVNLALGQKHQATDFWQEAYKYPRKTSYTFLVEKPEEGKRFVIERTANALPDFL